jgi:hypothetical protein
VNSTDLVGTWKPMSFETRLSTGEVSHPWIRSLSVGSFMTTRET